MTYYINVFQRVVRGQYLNIGDLMSETMFENEADAIEEVRLGYSGWAYLETIKRTEDGVEIVSFEEFVEDAA